MAKLRSMNVDNIKLGVGPAGGPEPPQPDTPFRILLLGDFQGDADASRSALKARKPLFIDRDNMDDVMSRIGVTLRLPIEDSVETHIVVHFNEIEDFHPDRLFERLDIFAALRDLRRRLEDVADFDDAAEELRGLLSRPSPSEQPPVTEQQSAADNRAGISPEGLLDQILDSGTAPAPGRAAGAHQANWERYLKQIVQPHAVPDIDDEQEEYLAAVDSLISSLMRSILHHPRFQEIEATWRAVHLLVQRLETDASLQLHLLDTSKAELAADLVQEDIRGTILHKFLVEQAVEIPGSQPWSLLLGNYTFSKSADDISLLERLARVSSLAGAPFLAAADSQILGCSSLHDQPDPKSWTARCAPEIESAWQALRQIPEAAYLGLCVPRFLLRLPYGKETSPAEEFAFEEITESVAHEDYLWGNPAFLCGLVLGQSFSRYSWSMQPGLVDAVDDLPLCVYEEEGERCVKPCAEVLLGERAREEIINQGLIALASVLNQNVVRIERIQSLGSPPAALAGRWT